MKEKWVPKVGERVLVYDKSKIWKGVIEKITPPYDLPWIRLTSSNSLEKFHIKQCRRIKEPRSVWIWEHRECSEYAPQLDTFLHIKEPEHRRCICCKSGRWVRFREVKE